MTGPLPARSGHLALLSSRLLHHQPQPHHHRLAHQKLLPFSRHRHRQFGAEADVAGDFVVGDLAGAEVLDLLFGGDLVGFSTQSRRRR